MSCAVRSLLAASLTVLALLAAAVPAAAQGDGPPRPVPLDRGWEFSTDPSGGFQPVSVPHVFDARPLTELWQGRVAWYRLRFTPPGGTDWNLRFEAVRRRATVWLNGTRIGDNRDPYTPFELPARTLRPGAENTLTVRVDNRRTPGFREGWWNWGGITRRVSLVPQGRVALRDLGLMSRVRCGADACRAGLVVDGWVANRTDALQRPLVAVRIAPRGGGRPTQLTVRARAIRPGEEARVRFTLPVPEPRLWSPEDPQLYDATVEARLGRTVEGRVQRRVGLRGVEVRGGALWLNGRRLQLRGASIQEDVQGRGPALRDEDIERIVGELRAVHANVTRAHYVLDERLLSALDEAGILVWNQAPVYHRDVQLRTAEGRARELGTLRGTIIAARSHPSVLTHSVANELSPQPDTNPTTRAWLEAAAATARDLDPTLPVALDVLSWPGFDRQSTYDRFDVLGINSYFGWYDGDEGHETGDFADLEPFLRQTRARYSRQALVMTEFGAESTMDGPADVKETYAFQAEYLRRNLEVVGRVPNMGGAIYWTLGEFAVKPEWDGGAEREGVPRDAIHNKALITYDGRRKPAWHVAERAFARMPLYTSPPVGGAEPRPQEASVGAGGLALGGGALALLGLLGALLVRTFREVWRLGAPPPQPQPQPAGERPRLRAVA
jgi:hypothetical protein